jgi:hypothetical protein
MTEKIKNNSEELEAVNIKYNALKNELESNIK